MESLVGSKRRGTIKTRHMSQKVVASPCLFIRVIWLFYFVTTTYAIDTGVSTKCAIYYAGRSTAPNMLYILKTPNFVSPGLISFLPPIAARSPKPRYRRVCCGGIMPSS